MIQLNGVTLSEDLVWSNEFDNPAISQNIQRTVLGLAVIQNMPLIKGREIHLVAQLYGNAFQGYYLRSEIEAFKILEQTGATVTLSYEGIDFQVIVKMGGVQMTPLIPRANQVSGDYYTGTLILIEV